MSTLVILGRQPALGLAELESIYGRESLRPIGEQAAELTLEHSKVNPVRLGGMVKLGAVLTSVETTHWKSVRQAVEALVLEQASRLPAGKLKLGLSTYGLDVDSREISALGLEVKKRLREHGRSARIIPNTEATLSSAQVLHNKLTRELGLEILLVQDGAYVTIAKTVAVQNIESYSLRDRGRPRRDARVGMLPPKLAQIIVNLAAGSQSPNSGFIVLDPFCGTGVILQEALLMGFGALGTDISPRMIEYSAANLAWLKNKFKTSDAYALAVGDACTQRWPTTPAVVAAETYLGRPFTSPPSADVLAQTTAECNIIIKKFLQNLRGQLPAGTRLCLAVPAWQIAPEKFKHLPLIDQIETLGYNRVCFEHVRDKDLIYFRENQIVARQLLVLTKQ